MLREQFLVNPSFERTPGLNSCPDGWFPFGEESTPDTEPVDPDMFKASEGSTFITLVTRGAVSAYPNTVEAIVTELEESLSPEACYEVSLDLVTRDNIGFCTSEGEYIKYDEAPVLKVYGSQNGDVHGDLLFESGAITSTEWEPASGLSCSDCRSPQVTGTESQTYRCTITDQFGCWFTEVFIIHIIEDQEDQMIIPNVFTPNSDGINDYFVIVNLPPFSTLLVFDRTGREVYLSENYGNEWNGDDKQGQPLPEGTYWYVLDTPGLSGNSKGEVYIKRNRND